jgi:hypothetical protein
MMQKKNSESAHSERNREEALMEIMRTSHLAAAQAAYATRSVNFVDELSEPSS